MALRLAVPTATVAQVLATLAAAVADMPPLVAATWAHAVRRVYRLAAAASRVHPRVAVAPTAAAAPVAEAVPTVVAAPAVAAVPTAAAAPVAAVVPTAAAAAPVAVAVARRVAAEAAMVVADIVANGKNTNTHALIHIFY